MAKMSLIKKNRQKLKKMDDYGYKKLQCEILLSEIFNNNYFINNEMTIDLLEKFQSCCLSSYSLNLLKNLKSNISLEREKLLINFDNKKYLFIRLPDVLGPFDESFRIWVYLEWIKNSRIRPIEFERADLVRNLSFVSRDDVNNLILNLILNAQNFKNEEIYNQAFNISFDEILTLKELVDVLYFILTENNSELINKGYNYIIPEDCYGKTYLPSVTVGAVCNYKAKNIGLFKPKENIIEFLRKTVYFFEKEAKTYKSEYEEMISELPKKVRKMY